MMNRKCRLCYSENTRFMFNKDKLIFFSCPSCKLIFMGNDFSQKETEDLYRYYNCIPEPLNPITEKRYLSLLRYFELFRKNSQLLDVGCSGGWFVSVAQSKGWEAIGTEMSREQVQICKDRNLKVYYGDISELDFKTGYFDIVTMSEVIEHLYNPRDTLKRVYDLLMPGGLLYMTTPNSDSLTRFILGSKWRIFHLEHVYYFTVAGITKLLKEAGFRNIRIKSGNISIVEIKTNLFANNGVTNVQDKEQVLRSQIENSAFLQPFKHFCNIFLNFFRAGDTLYIYAEK